MEQLARPEPPPDPAKVAERRRAGGPARALRRRTGGAQGRRGRRRLGGRWVYQLPWYLIIGPPGCGKTTALINSGLRFPLAERARSGRHPGIGGTRNCDWWFTDEAVLLDTAGRYTTQDSYARWTAPPGGFLGLLKKHRPRRPINGVLVAVSLSDLMQQSQTERGGPCRGDPPAGPGAVQDLRNRDPHLRDLHEGGPGGRLHGVLRGPEQGGARAGLGRDLPLRRRQGGDDLPRGLPRRAPGPGRASRPAPAPAHAAGAGPPQARPGLQLPAPVRRPRRALGQFLERPSPPPASRPAPWCGASISPAAPRPEPPSTGCSRPLRPISAWGVRGAPLRGDREELLRHAPAQGSDLSRGGARRARPAPGAPPAAGIALLAGRLDHQLLRQPHAYVAEVAGSVATIGGGSSP
jgi:DNA polymerase III delta prime subunit